MPCLCSLSHVHETFCSRASGWRGAAPSVAQNAMSAIERANYCEARHSIRHGQGRRDEGQPGSGSPCSTHHIPDSRRALCRSCHSRVPSYQSCNSRVARSAYRRLHMTLGCAYCTHNFFFFGIDQKFQAVTKALYTNLARPPTAHADE